MSIKNQGSNWIRKSTRLAIYHRDGFVCVVCAAAAENGATLSLDHIRPRYAGGTNKAKNLVTMCCECNTAKSAHSMAVWTRNLTEAGFNAAEVKRRIRKLSNRKLNRAEGRRLLKMRKAS